VYDPADREHVDTMKITNAWLAIEESMGLNDE
jgi:hypothetical protein